MRPYLAVALGRVGAVCYGLDDAPGLLQVEARVPGFYSRQGDWLLEVYEALEMRRPVFAAFLLKDVSIVTKEGVG